MKKDKTKCCTARQRIVLKKKIRAKQHITAWIASRQSAELWQEFLSVYELIAKIFCAVEPRKYC